ncbi:hypothetical protein WA158_001345 [Blastocystis sp. Blastoise]
MKISLRLVTFIFLLFFIQVTNAQHIRYSRSITEHLSNEFLNSFLEIFVFLDGFECDGDPDIRIIGYVSSTRYAPYEYNHPFETREILRFIQFVPLNLEKITFYNISCSSPIQENSEYLYTLFRVGNFYIQSEYFFNDDILTITHPAFTETYTLIHEEPCYTNDATQNALTSLKWIVFIGLIFILFTFLMLFYTYSTTLQIKEVLHFVKQE